MTYLEDAINDRKQIETAFNGLYLDIDSDKVYKITDDEARDLILSKFDKAVDMARRGLASGRAIEKYAEDRGVEFNDMVAFNEYMMAELEADREEEERLKYDIEEGEDNE